MGFVILTIIIVVVIAFGIKMVMDRSREKDASGDKVEKYDESWRRERFSSTMPTRDDSDGDDDDEDEEEDKKKKEPDEVVVFFKETFQGKRWVCRKCATENYINVMNCCVCNEKWMR